MIYENNIFFQQAQDFIQNNKLNELAIGKHVINEGNVWVNIVETELRSVDCACLEAHDEFIDIQIPLSCGESYGVKSRSECILVKGEMDKDNDIVFFDDKIEKVISAEIGQQTVFGPDMAHAPLIGSGMIRKAIFKVRVV